MLQQLVVDGPSAVDAPDGPASSDSLSRSKQHDGRSRQHDGRSRQHEGLFKWRCRALQAGHTGGGAACIFNTTSNTEAGSYPGLGSAGEEERGTQSRCAPCRPEAHLGCGGCVVCVCVVWVRV